MPEWPKGTVCKTVKRKLIVSSNLTLVSKKIKMAYINIILGFMGTLILFFFGVPIDINKNGSINLVIERTDKKIKTKYKVYKFLSWIGLLFLIASFIVQLLIIKLNLK